MSTAAIEFFVPGAERPVRFKLDPAMVYVWEYLLINPDSSLSEMISIRTEGQGLIHLPRYGAFRASYKDLDPQKGFDGRDVLYMLREFRPRWEAGFLEFRQDGHISLGELPLTEYQTWSSFMKAALQSPYLG